MKMIKAICGLGVVFGVSILVAQKNPNVERDEPEKISTDDRQSAYYTKEDLVAIESDTPKNIKEKLGLLYQQMSEGRLVDEKIIDEAVSCGKYAIPLAVKLISEKSFQGYQKNNGHQILRNLSDKKTIGFLLDLLKKTGAFRAIIYTLYPIDQDVASTAAYDALMDSDYSFRDRLYIFGIMAQLGVKKLPDLCHRFLRNYKKYDELRSTAYLYLNKYKGASPEMIDIYIRDIRQTMRNKRHVGHGQRAAVTALLSLDAEVLASNVNLKEAIKEYLIDLKQDQMENGKRIIGSTSRYERPIRYTRIEILSNLCFKAYGKRFIVAKKSKWWALSNAEIDEAQERYMIFVDN